MARGTAVQCFAFALLAVLAVGAARKIEDCCCEAETMQTGNDEDLHGRLQELRSQTFFKIFKVDLHSPCPFWHQNSVCHRQGCSVCPCDEKDIPESWKDEERAKAAAAPKANPWAAGAAKPKADGKTALVDRTLAGDFVGWRDADDTVWIAQHESTKDAPMSFINLLLNPEGYTGYEGKEAWRIWDSIYGANCFRGAKEDFCLEQRVLYRLISGFQSTIAAHTAARYDIAPGVVGRSLDIFEHKLGQHPERVQNLYFAFVFLLRAVHKATPILSDYSYYTGNVSADAHVKQLVRELLDSRMVRSCLPEQSFDESALFSRPDTKPLKAQFKEHFRNISMIIDCVSCEKCKLHGKLTILGLGTALRILFADKAVDELSLQRNEVIALIVTLSKVSHAIKLVHSFEAERSWLSKPENITLLAFGGAALVVITLALLVVLVVRRRAGGRLRLCRRRRTSVAPESAPVASDHTKAD